MLGLSRRCAWAARSVVFAFLVIFVASPVAAQPAKSAPAYYHLRQGVTFYIANPKGIAFDATIDVKDINVYLHGPQTAMVKLYDPAGNILFNDEIPDDGIETGGYDLAWGGWDHELWARGGTRDAGAEPMFRWDTFSEPRKLEKIQGAVRTIKVPAGKAGVYQLQVVGCDDHYAKLSLPPELKFGVVGHPDFLAGHGDQFRTTYLYVPEPPYYTKGRDLLELWLIENAYPRTRKLTLYNGAAALPMKNVPYKTTAASMTADQGIGRSEISLKGIAPGAVLKLVNEGDIDGDFLIRVHGIPPIFCPDEETAKYIAGGITAIKDGPVVSFHWQAELWDAVKGLKKEDLIVKPGAGEWNKMAKEDVAKLQLLQWELNNDPDAVDKTLKAIETALAKLEPFTIGKAFETPEISNAAFHDLITFYLFPVKGNGLYRNPAVKNIITLNMIRQWYRYRAGEVIWDTGELNIAYAQGFHWNEWEPVWSMKESLDPAVLKAFQKGVFNIGQRMFYANGLELVLSNGRTTIPMNLYHAYLITGDEKMKELSKRYLKRMVNAEDSPQAGGSKAGYFREHFAADGGYCTYPLFQLGRMWNLSGDADVYNSLDKLCTWINYVTLPAGPDTYVGPTSWNARIAMAAIEHTWGDGYKYLATKSQSAANLYRILQRGKEKYDVAEPAYEPGKPVPGNKALVLTHLTRGVLPAKPLPAESAQPFFEDLGDAHEFFCVRRGNYYAIAYAGRRVPFWMDLSLGGHSSFNGGGIAGLSVTGNTGAVIVGRQHKEYGWPLEEWNSLAAPVAVGTLDDGRIFNTGISRNTPAWDKAAWTLKTTGECITAPVNYERHYQFNEAGIAASVQVIDADMNKDVFQYREFFRKPHTHIAFAWELVPYYAAGGATVTVFDASGKSLGNLADQPVENVVAFEINNTRGGVRVKLDKPRTVKLSAKPDTVQVFKDGGHATDGRSRAVQIKICDKLEIAGRAELKYEIVPMPK